MGEPYWVENRQRYVGAIDVGWSAKGTRRRVTVSALTKRECRQKMRDKERELLLSGAPDEDSRAGLSVKAWAEMWLPRQERTLRPQAYATTRSYIHKWLIPAIGHKRLDRLSPGDVRAVARDMEDAGRATATARRGHGELLRMLADAHADGHQIPDRTRAVKLGRTSGSTGARDALSLEDALTVLSIAKARPDRARWVVALMTGLRPAEARGLTWDRVDFSSGVLIVDRQLKALPYKVARDRTSGFRVPRDFQAERLHDAYHLVSPKTDSGRRVVPMVGMVSGALMEWASSSPRSPHGLVFPGAGGRALDDKVDRAAWRDLCETAGIGERELYECRHTTATMLLAYGASEADIIAILGHASITSSKAYLHGNIESARESLSRIEAAMTKRIEA